MFRAWVLLMIVSIVAGCAPAKFEIVPAGDRFSDPSITGIVGKNNRLSTRSTQGGVHVDASGVYLDPFIHQDRSTGTILSAGFYVLHFNTSVDSGFSPIEEIIFLVNGVDRIVAQVTDYDSNFKVLSWNSIGKTYNTTFNESGVALMRADEFARVASASVLEVKITGGKRSHIYEAKDLVPGFAENLHTFALAAGMTDR